VRRIKFIFGVPLCWLVLSLIHAETGYRGYAIERAG
jgi:hypothetical protein